MDNQRVRLSKAMLKTALLQLLKEKPLGKITIYELCQKAELNRTTFYKYYGSQNELLDEIERDFFEKLAEYIQEINSPESDALLTVLNYLSSQRETVTVLAGALSDQTLSSHLFSIPSVRALFQDMVEAGYSEEEARYRKIYVFQGSYAILREWLSCDNPEPAEEIADLLWSLAPSGRKP